MLKTHKFARKPFYVDAVRVSDANIEEVAEWCAGSIEEDEEGRFVRVKVHRPLTERQTKAYVGDWVLRAGSGFKVYVPKAFDKSFEKVRTLTKAQADQAGIKVPHEPRPKNEKKHPSPKNMPRSLRTGNNVGDALMEARAKAKSEHPAAGSQKEPEFSVENPIQSESITAEAVQSELILPQVNATPAVNAENDINKLVAEAARYKEQ